MASAAHAGEIKFGQKPLAVDDGGKLTAEGRKAAVTSLDNEPGEDYWNCNLWAKVDRGAPGPLYVEFYSTWKGKRYQVFSHEDAAYDGGPYLSLSFELPGGQGFNKNTDYEVKIIQINERDKKVTLAAGRLKLNKVAPPKEEEQPEPEEEEEDDEMSEQDELDFGPSDADPPETDKPPATKSKGCTIDRGNSALPLGMLVLLTLGFRRRV